MDTVKCKLLKVDSSYYQFDYDNYDSSEFQQKVIKAESDWDEIPKEDYNFLQKWIGSSACNYVLLTPVPVENIKLVIAEEVNRIKRSEEELKRKQQQLKKREEEERKKKEEKKIANAKKKIEKLQQLLAEKEKS